jgi:hypothetical protein
MVHYHRIELFDRLSPIQFPPTQFKRSRSDSHNRVNYVQRVTDADASVDLFYAISSAIDIFPAFSIKNMSKSKFKEPNQGC